MKNLLDTREGITRAARPFSRLQGHQGDADVSSGLPAARSVEETRDVGRFEEGSRLSRQSQEARKHTDREDPSLLCGYTPCAFKILLRPLKSQCRCTSFRRSLTASHPNKAFKQNSARASWSHSDASCGHGLHRRAFTTSCPQAVSPKQTSKKRERLVDTMPVCTPEILQLARWVADYYACPLGEVIKATLPPGMIRRQTARAAFVKPKLRRFVRVRQPLTQTKKNSAKHSNAFSQRSKAMANAVAIVAQNAGVSAATVSSLEKKGTRRGLRSKQCVAIQ